MKNVLKGLFFYQVEHCAGPLAYIYEAEDSLVCEFDLPGINPDEVSVTIYEDVLVIEGTRTEPDAGPKLKYLCMERDVKGFRRVLKPPVPVNIMAAEASYADGVVTIRFPKLKGKLVKVKIERK